MTISTSRTSVCYQQLHFNASVEEIDQVHSENSFAA